MRRSIGIQLLLVFFVACTNNNTLNTSGYEPLKKPEQSEIRFLGHWLDEGKKEQLLKEAITEFEFTHQELSIELRYLENMYKSGLISENFGKYNAEQIISENPDWDILRVNNDFWNISNFINEPDYMQKYLVDFSQIPEFVENTRPELVSDAVKAQYGGIIPGPFIDGYNWPIWVNTNVAQKIGITVKQFNMTFQDFLGYVKAVSEYNQQHGDSIISIFEAKDFATTHTLAEILFFSELDNYEDMVNFNYSKTKIIAWEKVLSDLEKLAQFKPLPKKWNELVWVENMNAPLDDKCLFFINGSWMYNIWLKTDEKKIIKMMPAEMPVYKPGKICFGGYNVTWAVPKKAKNRDNAVKFLLYLNSNEIAEKWTRYTKSPTGIKGRMATLSFGNDTFEDFQVTIDNKYNNRKISLLFGSAFCFGHQNSNINNYAIDVLSGNVNAATAIKEIRVNLKKY